MDSFAVWLQTELRNRGMTQAELSRASGLTTAAVANLVNSRRNPGSDACSKNAHALKLPEDVVFRAAGLLAQNPKANPEDERANHLIQTLKKPASKQRAIDYLQLLIEQEEREERENAAKKNHPVTQPR